MIKSFADSATRRLHETGRGRFGGLDTERAQELLAALDAAASLAELSPLKSIGLHKLKGNRKGQWAMTISGPWRLCFRFRDGDAYDVQVVDYH
jgi:proteic killer suppression protein